jgi:PAS domain S-box-containing protein
MTISQEIEAVYERALCLRQHALASPLHPDLVDKALEDLYFVLEELQTSHERLCQQQQELLATQQAIDLERQQYQTLFDLAPNGYVVTDLKGTIRHANRSAVSLLGAPHETLINKPLLVFVHEPDRPWFQAQSANLIPGAMWEVTLKVRRDRLISVAIAVTQVKSTPLRDVLLWSLSDMTHRTQLELQLQAARDELELQVAERTAELLQAKAQLQAMAESGHQNSNTQGSSHH